MTVKAKIFSLVAQADGSAREDDAWTIMRQASAKLHEADVHHNLGFMDAEEGPDPSVWRTEQGRVVIRCPEDSRVGAGIVAVSAYFENGGWCADYLTEIGEDWEVLA